MQSVEARIVTIMLTMFCRVRGYQFKSEGPGESKKNAKVFQVYDQSGESLAETPAVPSPVTNAGTLESQGFAEPQSS